MKVKYRVSGAEKFVENPLVGVLAWMRGDADIIPDGPGDSDLIDLINLEMDKLRPRVTPEDLAKIKAHSDPENWGSLRDRFKPHILELWSQAGEGKGYLELQAIIRHLEHTGEFGRYLHDTISSRIREMANPDIETPTFLKHYVDGQRTGRYVLNKQALVVNPKAGVEGEVKA